MEIPVETPVEVPVEVVPIEVYPDLVRLIMRKMIDFTPVELMRVARISKSFYTVIKKDYVDYGVKANLAQLFKMFGTTVTVDDLINDKVYIFG